jgi:sporulation and spore germination protein
VKKIVALAILVVLGGSLGFIAASRGSEGAVSLGPAPRQTGSTGSDGTGTANALALPTVEVWFARGDRLVPQSRTHRRTPRVATAALTALLAGPTRAERASGLATAIPAGTRLLGVSVKGGVATVDLTSQYQSGGGSRSMQLRLGQVVYTLTQFPTVKSVRFQLDGAPVNVFSSEGIVLAKPVGRGDYSNLSPQPLAGSWRPIASKPFPVDGPVTSVWAGTQMLVFSRHQLMGRDARGNPYSRGALNVAAGYYALTNSWRSLEPPAKTSSSMGYSSAWTGKEMLVWGQGTRLAYNPATRTWRHLPGSRLLSVHDGFGLSAWTGKELIGWGGGCCGDAFSDGVAYNPATNSWRALPRSPLARSQAPTGTWTGRELVILVGNFDPDGKPWPARLARAAAYNPAANTWRRIAPIPSPRTGATAVWDGHEVLVVGGSGPARAGRAPVPAAVGFAYNPATNGWRRLPPMESGRTDFAAVWTGKRLLLWGGNAGRGGGPLVIPPHGLAYDPRTNRWSPLPQAPLAGRLDPTAVWTGRSMIVWGGEVSSCEKRNAPCLTTHFRDGAAFTPRS